MQMIKTRVVNRSTFLMNVRKLESRENLIGDHPQHCSSELARDAALQTRRSFLTECHPTPCSKSMHRKSRHGLWLIVADQEDN